MKVLNEKEVGEIYDQGKEAMFVWPNTQRRDAGELDQQLRRAGVY